MLFYLIELIEGRRERDCFLFVVFVMDTLYLIFVFLMGRSMGSLPGKGTKMCWKSYWKCFWWGVDGIFSFHSPGFIQGKVVSAIICAFHPKSVLELSVLQNTGILHDGHFTMSSVFGLFMGKKKR